MNLGMTELLMIFGIVLVLFGGRRLPGLGKAMGDTIREFKDSLSGKEERVEKQAELPMQNPQPNAHTTAAPVEEKDKVKS